MKIPLLVLILVVGPAPAGALAAGISGVSVELNTVGQVRLGLNFEISERINREASSDALPETRWRLLDQENGDTLYASSEGIGFTTRFVQFSIESPTNEIASRFVSRERPFYLEVDQAIPVILADGSRFVLTPEDARRFSLELGELTPRQVELLKEHVAGDYLLSRDRLDFSRQIDDGDSLEAENVLSFSLVRPVRLPGMERTPVYWWARGRVGTWSRSPLNFVELGTRAQTAIQPVLAGAFSLRGTAEVDYAGDQTFERTAWNFMAGFEGLVPNLIDLTGGANRLRLKPVLKVAAGYALRPQDQALFGDEKTSWEWMSAFDYYVPVATRYALIYSAEARYSDNARPGDKLRFWNAASIAYDLPLEDLKLLIKWESGRGPFVSEEGSRLLAGALLDYLPF